MLATYREKGTGRARYVRLDLWDIGVFGEVYALGRLGDEKLHAFALSDLTVRKGEPVGADEVVARLARRKR